MTSDAKSAKPAKSRNSTSRYSEYFNKNVLTGSSSINLVAVKGDIDGAYDVLKMMAVPLVSNGFKDKFFARGDLFDQIMDGQGSAILRLELPQEIDKIVLMKIGKLNSTIPNGAVAYNSEPARTVSRDIFISILSRKSGAILKSGKIIAKGIGYSDEATHESYLEDLKEELQQFQAFFDYQG